MKTQISKQILSLVLALMLVLSVLPMIPMTASAAETPNYISEIGLAVGSTAEEAKNKLSGYTIIEKDLNAGAGGKYIYMGYKTTNDPSQAITGLAFYQTGLDSSYANTSYTFDGRTFYKHGASVEANVPNNAEEYSNRFVDVNDACGSDTDYIFLYICKERSSDPITEIVINNSSSYSGYTTAKSYGYKTDISTSDTPQDLNASAGGEYIYLHYRTLNATIKADYYYLNASGSRTSSTYTKVVQKHTTTLTDKPSVPSTVTYNGYTLSFKGWRTDNTAAAATTTSPSVTYLTSPQTYRAIYTTNVNLTYNANGGTDVPSTQTATQYINAGSSSVAKSNVSFTVPTFTPMHSTKCFLGWSTSSSATSAAYTAGKSISVSGNTTLYAVYSSTHNDSNGDKYCNRCGRSLDDAALKDGVYQISNAAELVWFAQQVNSGNNSIKGKLMNDIDLSGITWTPIGTTSSLYTGTFDGQGFRIKNMTIDTTATYQGLFGAVSGGVHIKNVIIDASCSIKAGNYSAALVGGSNGSGSVIIENCGNEASVNAGQNASGIFGVNMNSAATVTIRNCYNTGNITATKDGGGISGWIGADGCTATNCWSSGVVTNGDSFAHGRNTATFTNCHYLESLTASTLSGINTFTAEQLENGALTYLLNGSTSEGDLVWYQTIGTDATPVFGGDRVYKLSDGTYSNHLPVAQAGTEQYSSLQEAINAGTGYVKLLADVAEDVTVSGDLYLDLAGFTLTGNITGTGKLYLMDSATDDFEGDYGKLTGTVEASVETITERSGKTYLTVNEEGVYSAHRYEVKLTYVSLDPNNDALGYKAQFNGDETVTKYVTGFGFNLWVSEDNVKTYTKDGAFTNGQTLTLRLKNIMAANGGEMTINGNAFVTFSVSEDAVTGADHSTTMKQVLQTVNENFDSYTETQKNAVKAFCTKFETAMSEWALSNILP